MDQWLFTFLAPCTFSHTLSFSDKSEADKEALLQKKKKESENSLEGNLCTTQGIFTGEYVAARN